MQELIEAVKAWPVIIQGTLGSALFWLLLLIGQYATTKISSLYSHHSKMGRKSWLVSAQLKYLGASTDNEMEIVRCVATLVYRSLRFLFKALMWLVMGLIFQQFFTLASVIGFCGCLYYLFKAYEIVSPIRYEEDAALKLAEINAEIEKNENA